MDLSSHDLALWALAGAKTRQTCPIVRYPQNDIMYLETGFLDRGRWSQAKICRICPQRVARN
jgi:hypothetical protein